MHSSRISLFIGIVTTCLYGHQALGFRPASQGIILEESPQVLQELLEEKLPPPPPPPRKITKLDKFLRDSGLIEVAKIILKSKPGDLSGVPEVKIILKAAAKVLNKIVSLLQRLGVTYPTTVDFSFPLLENIKKILGRIEVVTCDKLDNAYVVYP